MSPRPLHTIKTTVPHKKELGDEHFLMAFGYGVGAIFAHSMIGSAVIGTFYFITAIIHICLQRRASNV